MTTHGGYTILLGNNSAFYDEVVKQPWGTVWDGTHGGGQEQWVKSLNSEMRWQLLDTELKRDQYQSLLAKQTILEHPAVFVKACLLRVSRFWSLVPAGPAAVGLPEIVLWGLVLFYGTLWTLLLIGTIRVLRTARPFHYFHYWLPLCALIIALTCVHAIYWSNARMRAPTMPAIVLLAGFAIGGPTRSAKPNIEIG